LQAGGDGAGVEGVGVDALAGPAARGLDREQRVGGLALAVCGEGVVGAELEVQVVEDDRGEQVAAGAHGHLPRLTGARVLLVAHCQRRVVERLTAVVDD
jgi:hypothetical protein